MLYERLLAALPAGRAQYRAARGLGGACRRPSSARRWRAGGRACRPLIARDGLGSAFIDPALAIAATARARRLQFGHRLRAMTLRRRAGDGAAISARKRSSWPPSDAVILAVPPVVAAALVPGPADADEFRAIVNAHFRIAPPQDLAADHRRHQRHGGMAVRLSRPAVGDHQRRRPSARHAARGAGRANLARGRADRGLRCAAAALADRARAARDLRRDARRRMPNGRGRRPPGATCVLAGDWTATGLPATIEGAIRSGHKAAAACRRNAPH